MIVTLILMDYKAYKNRAPSTVGNKNFGKAAKLPESKELLSDQGSTAGHAIH